MGRLALLQIMTKLPSVQVYGRKKTATAVAHCKRGKGLIKVSGKPLDLVTPETLRYKLQEPILHLGKARFEGVDIRIRVNGGGRVSQIYAIRQALAKSLVSYYQKFVDEGSKKERDQKVRRSRSQSKIPEILPLKFLIAGNFFVCFSC